LAEQRTGITCIGAHAAFSGRKRLTGCKFYGTQKRRKLIKVYAISFMP
jgi:hypothetical protein